MTATEPPTDAVQHATGADPERPPAPRRGPGARLIAISTIGAWLAVALFVGAVGTLALPVSNPHVQSCGAPGLFLVRGTADAPLYDAQDKPIHGFDDARLTQAFKHRCSKLVADRGVLAAPLGAAFVVVGLAALVLAFVGHRVARVADLAEWTEGQVGRTTSSGVPM